MECIIKGDSLWQIYQKLGHIIKTSRSDSIKMPFVFQMNGRVFVDLPEIEQGTVKWYYEEFRHGLSNARWNGKEDWYLSYARRLTMSQCGNNQFQDGLECLKADKRSRRCVLYTYNPFIDGKDYRPALTYVSFWINDNVLNMSSHWRSQELFFAFPLNCVAMLSLMKMFYNELLVYYGELKMGVYRHSIDMGMLYHEICIQNIQWDFTKYFHLIQEDELKFLWGIVDFKKEDEFDEHYK